MGHRHLYSTSQMFESDQEQNWNHMHPDQHYMHLGRASTSENGSIFYPMETMSVDGNPFSSHWNSAPRSNGYASSSLGIEAPPHQPDAPGSSHDHLLHSGTAGAFCPVPENYVHHASSSSYDRPTFHVVDTGFVDLTMGSGRGPHKRKSPGIPSVCERGSSSRYYNAGSSTDLPIPPEVRQEKPSIESQYIPWDHNHINMTPTHRGNSLSLRGEGPVRNVRSRSALDLESNLARTHLSSNHLHNSYSTSHSIDHSSTVDLSGPSSSTLTRDWSQMNISPVQGRVPASDTSGFSHETDHFLVGSSASNGSVDIGGYHHEYTTSRNPSVPQSFPSNSTQSVRGVRSNYSQRSTPAFRASSNSRLGHGTPDDGLHMVAENYSSRHPRPLATIGWRNNDRNGRSRISSDRYRSLADEASLHDRFSSEGFMIVDRATFYGPRHLVDQHRDMRMDIDNMGYEELLALGERIGHVSTGLSEDLIPKCLTETMYSQERSQEDGSCVICLEDYKDMDDIGALKTCGHDYHVSCVRKWLSMKSICPICKASVLPDDMKEK
ncbi:RING/U-box superfamily protein [Quillaja saponaria]|uniref:RING-type E3 ubiquitin transferase n=1 Tax=Quillaja saponaria TaxID=32244 RepID=A0AAD7Q8V0_QUISA|nr:RING/U-box superfamily protein [Quillaja saponaria]KAJ7976980.1 RING/U-box superfamily protein [Quillaja saponaria]